jgi:hypothetical protein
MQDPDRDGAASLFADFNPDFDPLFLVVITMMVIDIDPLLDPDFEPGVALLNPLPELEFGPIRLDSLFDPDLDTGIVVVVPVIRRLRSYRTSGERKSRNCSNTHGAHEIRHFDHFLNESFRGAGWFPGAGAYSRLKISYRFPAQPLSHSDLGEIRDF